VIPFFTFFLDNRLRNAPYRSQVLQSLIPLTLGVVIATYGDGDHSYSSLGFLITLFSALLAGLKTMMTRYLLDELRRNGDNPSLVLLRKITPIAFCQVLASAYFAEEYAKLYETITWERLAQLVLNALLAFTINIVSFRTAGFVSPLSMNIAANVKQALIVLMNPKLGGQDWNSQMHFTGVLFTLVGSAWYLGILLAEGRVESLFI
jgi:drug/metabolite transporter (DMT)-like permease